MSELLLLSVVCFVAMVSPGPDFILVTRNSLLYPRGQALSTAAGIIVGCLVHASYCILGLAIIITKSVLLFSLIKYAGAGYLIFLGLKGILSSSTEEIHINSAEAPKTITLRAAFAQGFLCNLLNPKLAVFLLSLFTQFVSVDASLSQKAAVAGVFVLESALYWPSLVLLLQTGIVQRIINRSKLILDRTCGALLVYLGVRVAIARD